jgi:hypothetical protein
MPPECLWSFSHPKRRASRYHSDPDYTRWLNGAGIAVVRKLKKDASGEYERWLWVCPDAVSRQLLSKTRFGEENVGEHLMRLKGARRERHRLGGDERFNGVEIPMSTVREVFDAKSDEELEQEKFV